MKWLKHGKEGYGGHQWNIGAYDGDTLLLRGKFSGLTGKRTTKASGQFGQISHGPKLGIYAKGELNKSFRVSKINTPEIGDPYSHTARNALHGYLEKGININMLGKDKYHRDLVDVSLKRPELGKTRDVALRMVGAGLGKPYFGRAADRLLVPKSTRKEFYRRMTSAHYNKRGNWQKGRWGSGDLP